MIENFDEVSRQLKELATVINTFKSEAVQLRIIEIVLAGGKFQTAKRTELDDLDEEETKAPRKRRRRKKAAEKKPSDGTNAPKGKRKSSGTGAVATVASIYDAGFFSKPRAIKDILEHCETNLARKIKANEISGELGRMVRNGELTRTKNADGQYRYKKRLIPRWSKPSVASTSDFEAN